MLQYFGFIEVDNPYDSYIVVNPVQTLLTSIEGLPDGGSSEGVTKSALIAATQGCNINAAPKTFVIKASFEYSSWTNILEQSSLSMNKIRSDNLEAVMYKLIIDAEISKLKGFLIKKSSTNQLDEIEIIARLFIKEKIKLLEMSLKIKT